MNLRGPFSHLCGQAQTLGSVPAELWADSGRTTGDLHLAGVDLGGVQAGFGCAS